MGEAATRGSVHTHHTHPHTQSFSLSHTHTHSHIQTHKHMHARRFTQPHSLIHSLTTQRFQRNVKKHNGSRNHFVSLRTYLHTLHAQLTHTTHARTHTRTTRGHARTTPMHTISAHILAEIPVAYAARLPPPSVIHPSPLLPALFLAHPLHPHKCTYYHGERKGDRERGRERERPIDRQRARLDTR